MTLYMCVVLYHPWVAWPSALVVVRSMMSKVHKDCMCHLVSLGYRPPPFRARLNYAHAYAANIRRTWKAWAETSREGRRGVDAWRRGT